MDRLNVLLVAPRTDLLFVDAEVQDILRSGLKVTPMLGVVNHSDLVREFNNPTTYDVLWLATHATPEGVMLSDGILTTQLLTGLCRGSFSLIVINSCQSIHTAQMIQNETEAEIIATIVDVPDAEAFQVGSRFARRLAKTGNVEDAYRSARPGGNKTYVRLAGHAATMPSDDVIKKLIDVVAELTRKLTDLEGRLEIMEGINNRGFKPAEWQVWLFLVLIGSIALGIFMLIIFRSAI